MKTITDIRVSLEPVRARLGDLHGKETFRVPPSRRWGSLHRRNIRGVAAVRQTSSTLFPGKFRDGLGGCYGKTGGSLGFAGGGRFFLDSSKGNRLATDYVAPLWR